MEHFFPRMILRSMMQEEPEVLLTEYRILRSIKNERMPEYIDQLGGGRGFASDEIERSETKKFDPKFPRRLFFNTFANNQPLDDKLKFLLIQRRNLLGNVPERMSQPQWADLGLG